MIQFPNPCLRYSVELIARSDRYAKFSQFIPSHNLYLKAIKRRTRILLVGNNVARIDSGPTSGKRLSRPQACCDQLEKKKEKEKKTEFSIYVPMYMIVRGAPRGYPTKLHSEFQYSAYHISTLKRRQRCPGITLRFLCP